MLNKTKFWSNKKEVDTGFKIDNKISLCWLWQGSLDKDGYGQIMVDYKHLRTHVLAYKLTYENYRTYNMILHKCNIKGCYNPLHLYQGDASQNALDAINSGNNHQKIRHTVHRDMNIPLKILKIIKERREKHKEFVLHALHLEIISELILEMGE